MEPILISYIKLGEREGDKPPPPSRLKTVVDFRTTFSSCTHEIATAIFQQGRSSSNRPLTTQSALRWVAACHKTSMVTTKELITTQVSEWKIQSRNNSSDRCLNFELSLLPDKTGHKILGIFLADQEQQCACCSDGFDSRYLLFENIIKRV